MTPSLRNRLLLILLPVTALVWMLFTFVIYAETGNEVDELIDAQLVQSASVLLTLLSHEFHEEEAYRGRVYEDETRNVPQDMGKYNHKYEQKLVFQMWMLASNRLALRSQGAPETPMTDLLEGFSNRVINGESWRVYALTDINRGLQVQVGEGNERRGELKITIAERILIPALVSLPALALLIWVGVGRAMKPLRVIAQDVENREAGKLTPIDDAPVPTEARPLVHAINNLFQRLQETFENERRFTADAAHELRTPLAALKTQAEVALRAQEDGSRTEALRQVITGVDRAGHLVQQLLTLARIDPESWHGGRGVFNLREMAADTVAELTPQALSKHIDLGLQAPAEAVKVTGDVGMVHLLVRNLVDNAIKYTPAQGTVTVSVERQGGRICLAVDDSGPGIPREDRERVFERFYRRLGTGSAGSGLGLSIVRRIAELHEAGIDLLDSDLGGLRVVVCFSSAPTS